jgi:hypothetical protein
MIEDRTVFLQAILAYLSVYLIGLAFFVPFQRILAASMRQHYEMCRTRFRKRERPMR